MVEFYSIGQENKDIEHPFQLRNLGIEKVSMMIGSYGRSWDGNANNRSTTLYAKVTPEDYDKLFAEKITKIKPPYELSKLLDYHLRWYLSTDNNSKDNFFKHIKYVVIPEVKKKKDKDVYAQLINEWIEENSKQIPRHMNKVNIGDINAPTQILIDSNGAIQNQTVNYSNDSIIELFELIKADLKDNQSDLKDDLLIELENATKHLKNNKDINSRLKTIGGLIKDVGINVFANLAAAPIYDQLKPLLGI